MRSAPRISSDTSGDITSSAILTPTFCSCSSGNASSSGVRASPCSKNRRGGQGADLSPEESRVGADWSYMPRRTLRQIIDDEASFNFSPLLSYSCWGLAQFYVRPSQQSTLLRPRSSISVALKNLASRSENGDILVAYNPIGLFVSLGSTRELWSRQGTSASAFGRQRLNT